MVYCCLGLHCVADSVNMQNCSNKKMAFGAAPHLPFTRHSSPFPLRILSYFWSGKLRRSTLGFLLSGLMVCAQASGDLATLMQLLDEHDIQYDRSGANAAMFDSFLSFVDPYAVLLGTNCVDTETKPSSVLAIEEWSEGILYTKLNGFYDMGTTSVTSRLRNWITNDVAGVIIDLRGAGGDNLAATDALFGDIVEPDVTLYEIRNGLDTVVETHRSARGPKVRGMPPLMLLIDKGTHGASETFAAACATRDGLMLIGSATRGDPGLREHIALGESNTLYIATRWIVPSIGDRYDGTGVQPHIDIEDMGHTSSAEDESSLTQRDTVDAASASAVDDEAVQSNLNKSEETLPSEAPRENSGYDAPDTSIGQHRDLIQTRARDVLLGLEALRKK